MATCCTSWGTAFAMGSFHLFVPPKWSRIFFMEKRVFDPFWSQNGPFSRHFGVLACDNGFSPFGCFEQVLG